MKMSSRQSARARPWASSKRPRRDCPSDMALQVPISASMSQRVQLARTLLGLQNTAWCPERAYTPRNMPSELPMSNISGWVRPLVPTEASGANSPLRATGVTARLSHRKFSSASCKDLYRNVKPASWVLQEMTFWPSSTTEAPSPNTDCKQQPTTTAQSLQPVFRRQQL